MISIPLFLSQEHPCSYLEGEQAQSMFVHPSYPVTPSIYAQLIEQGFRRSGDEVYAPHCAHCAACIPVRLPVKNLNQAEVKNAACTRTLIHKSSSNLLFLSKLIMICTYAIRLSDTATALWPTPALMITSVSLVVRGATPDCRVFHQ